ncbi:MAG: hypothetical protein NTW29_03950 [Bacteroidetes bacterium]|nr:hypothetical protein [Bacteroidota bacterium]
MIRKLLITGGLMFASLPFFAQDNFDSPAFSTALKKLDADRTKLFANGKGSLIRTIGSFYSLYQSTIPIPGSDSFTVSVPVSSGRLYASYFFKSSVTLMDAKARSAKLVSALKNTFPESLQETQRTDTVNNFIYYKTCLQQAPFANCPEADYDVYIVFFKGAYQLVLRAYGKKSLPLPVKKQELITNITADDPQLEQKIRYLMTSMENFFETEKGKETLNSNEFYREFETKTSIWGLTGKIKDRKFETSVYFSADYRVLVDPAAAQKLYEKLKSIFMGLGKFRFSNETGDSNRKSIFGRQDNSAAAPGFTVVIDCYMLAGAPSAGFLLIKKKNSN